MKEAHKKAIEAATEAGAIIGAVAHYELVKVICPVSEEGTLPFFGMYGVFHELPRYRL